VSAPAREAALNLERMAHAPPAIDARKVRRIILEQSKRANVGHIGSCLSVVEILCALYGQVLEIPSLGHRDRDRFLLSKGHAALALYAVLALRGWVTEAELNTFCGDNTRFGVHPDTTVTGIDFSSGSLGHGPGVAAGSALGARLQNSRRHVYCLISDAECNAGSVWEAAMFAVHHRLDNLTLIVDWNGQQAFGLTCDVLACPNLPERWQAFGWQTSQVDGHSIPELVTALQRESKSRDGNPRIVFARTRFGKGISFMEKGVPITQTHLRVHPINWHYLPMSDLEYEIAMSELESSA